MATYIGATEAKALVGRHHHMLRGCRVGSDVQIPQYAHARPDWDAWRQRRWMPQQSPWGGGYAQPAATPSVSVTPSGARGAVVNVQNQAGWREPTRREWESRPRRHNWQERQRRKQWWENLYPGIPFVGAEALAEAHEAAGGTPLFGPLPGETSGGPGSGSVGHGPYGDPHGSRGWSTWGYFRHRGAGGSPLHGQPFVGAGAGGNPLVAAAAQYGIPPRAALVPAPDPTMANRQVLPMNTGGQSVGVGLTAIITSRPQRVAFRPERVFVSSTGASTQGAAAWLVNDITIGNRSQYVQQGALPGDMFANVAIDSFITFETAQTAMDVTMSVTFNDPAISEGEPFYGSLIGTAAMNAM